MVPRVLCCAGRTVTPERIGCLCRQVLGIQVNFGADRVQGFLQVCHLLSDPLLMIDQELPSLFLIPRAFPKQLRICADIGKRHP